MSIKQRMLTEVAKSIEVAYRLVQPVYAVWCGHGSACGYQHQPELQKQ